jgi:hypothetical protein
MELKTHKIKKIKKKIKNNNKKIKKILIFGVIIIKNLEFLKKKKI